MSRTELDVVALVPTGTPHAKAWEDGAVNRALNQLSTAVAAQNTQGLDTDGTIEVHPWHGAFVSNRSLAAFQAGATGLALETPELAHVSSLTTAISHGAYLQRIHGGRVLSVVLFGARPSSDDVRSACRALGRLDPRIFTVIWPIGGALGAEALAEFAKLDDSVKGLGDRCAVYLPPDDAETSEEILRETFGRPFQAWRTYSA